MRNLVLALVLMDCRNLPSSPWHGFPILKAAPLVTLLHDLKSFTDQIPLDSPLADLRPMLERVVRQYEAFLTTVCLFVHRGETDTFLVCWCLR